MTTAVVDQGDNQTEYKESLQEFFRAGNLTLVPVWLRKVRDEGKIDDLRKAIEFLTAATAAAVEKKSDPYSNLPVFNFTFVNGGVQATPVAMVEEVSPAPVAPPGKVAPTISLPATELIQEMDVQLGTPPQVTPEQLSALRDELDDMLKGL